MMRKILSTLLVVMAFVLNASAQKTVTGTVTDPGGKAVSNASVGVTGSTFGAYTDADGKFTISVPASTNSLTITAVGFDPYRAPIRGNVANASLVLKKNDLEEVVVTGISRVKKTEFTGATTKITQKDIESKPVGSFDQILQGRAPGLLALTGSGQPGNNSTIIIRGTGSIQGGSGPLYVVDGIPVEAGAFQNLNPNDFASVDVLRDAAATALYGSRGSAGIIVITTKRGASGKMKLTYDGQYGIKSAPDFAFTPMSTEQLLQAQENYGKIVGATASIITLPGYYYSQLNPRYATLTTAQKATEAATYDSLKKINTNWNNEVFRKGIFQSHQLSLSGGQGRTRMYSSLGYYAEEGTTLRSNMQRFTARNNFDYADDKFTAAISLNLGVTKREFQQSSDFNTSNPFASSGLGVPYMKVRNADGSYVTGVGNQYVVNNNLDQTLYDENYNNQFKGTFGLQFAYKITKNITAALTTGIDFRETQATNYGSPLVFTRRSSTSITGKAGFQLESLNRFLTGNVRPSVTFRKLYSEKHDIEVTALGEYVTERGKAFSIQGFGADIKRPNTIQALPLVNSANQFYPNISGSKGANALYSGLATARYTYGGKYTVSGSFRRDGSSKLPIETRWQNFYSAGVTWEASKENFLKNSRIVNQLSVRANYGSAGNSNNFPGGDFPYQATYTGGSYSGLNTIIATYPGNPALKWETTFTANFGVDFSLFNNRLYGDVNLYDKRTKDLFVQKTLSQTSGFSGLNGFINVNGGQLSNKGIEVTLNYDVVKSNKVTWTVFGNFGYNKNNVEDLGGLASFEQGTELITVGKPLGSHYEIKWGGVDAATGQPLYYTKDGQLTTVYNASNRVQEYGTWEAPWKGGFGTRVAFGGFDLSTLFSWQSGATKVDNLEYFLENPSFLSQGFNQSASLNQWQQPGDKASTPSPLYPVNFSSKIIHDASFLRLRDVTLSFTLPQSVLEKSKVVSKVRFYVQGTNLYLWTKWRGRDPEAGATNINISEYPNPRAITTGLSITF